MEPLKPKDDWTDEDHDTVYANKARQSKMKVTKFCCVNFLKSNLLVLSMLVGVVVGVSIGVGLNSMDPKLTKPQIVYLRFPGDIFIQMMKMLLIPIVVSSLLCSTAEIDIRSSGKIGLRALGYYVVTLILASILGITLAVTIRPGERTSGRIAGTGQQYNIQSSPGLAFMDLFRNMVPDNIVEVCFTSKKTTYLTKNISSPELSVPSLIKALTNITDDNLKNMTNITEAYKTETSLLTEKVSGINMIGLVVCSIVFGCVTSAAGQEGKAFLDFFRSLRCVTFRLVAIFIWYSPVGIAFLIAAKLAEMDNPAKTFQDLGIFAVSVVTGLVIHGFVVLSLIFLVVVRKNPFKFLPAMFPAMVFAFGSESSSATLPLTIKCLEEKNGVDPRVTKLIASVGATVNMDGTCLYFTMMAVFVAQLNNIPLSAGELVTISILALSIAMGAAGIPGAGVVYMIMILTSMGLPTEDISTLLAVDWFLARCRTAINVLGDGYGAGIIEHLSRHELRKMNLMVNVNGSTKNIEDGELETSKL